MLRHLLSHQSCSVDQAWYHWKGVKTFRIQGMMGLPGEKGANNFSLNFSFPRGQSLGRDWELQVPQHTYTCTCTCTHAHTCMLMHIVESRGMCFRGMQIRILSVGRCQEYQCLGGGCEQHLAPQKGSNYRIAQGRYQVVSSKVLNYNSFEAGGRWAPG